MDVYFQLRALLRDQCAQVRSQPQFQVKPFISRRGRRSCPASAIDQARVLTTPDPEWRRTLNWP